jgi:YidC/Oxa1 family membrane protein insertase
MHTAKKMQDMKPHLDKLQAKHKKDPKKLQEEQLRLYQEAGINPASGCLFMILQMPIFIALYQTLSTFIGTNSGPGLATINKALYFPFLKISQIDPWFFGINLIVTPEKAGNPLYYLIPVITAVLQFFQYQVSVPAAPVTEPVAKELKEGQKEEKKDDAGDFQKAMNTQMKFIFPLMIGWFSLRMPVGLSLYWNIFSLFSIMQYRQINSKKK